MTNEEVNKSYESGPIWEYANDGEINKDDFDVTKIYILWDQGYKQAILTIEELINYFDYSEYTENHWVSVIEND